MYLIIFVTKIKMNSSNIIDAAYIILQQNKLSLKVTTTAVIMI